MNNWNQLKPESKLWIYGAQRELSEQENNQINLLLDQFCDTWAAHGAKLDCGFNILHNRLILIAVDEESAAASGCSIDKSVEIVKDIDAQFNLDLFNRMRSYHVIKVPQTKITSYEASEINQLLGSGELDQDSRMVNMQALILSEIAPNFTRALSETWLKKYLNKRTAV
jgi:hypothetical protein